MKFHKPGLDPVRISDHAFHIDFQGIPAYSNKFIETFGFYAGFSAVRRKEGWFHITPNGEPLYPNLYEWCGNFQEGFFPVKEKTDLYFHINQEDLIVYQQRYRYVVDFREVSAVVCNELGLHTRIDYYGKFLHGKWFLDLDVFIKALQELKMKLDGFMSIN